MPASSFSGVGLGLGVSSKLINMMGGEVSFHSEVGKGTKFEFTMIFDTDPTLEDEKLKDIKDNDLTGLKVLVAEDNQISQKLVTLILRKMGVGPIIVNDGREAVNRCIEERFDIVLMDIRMPKLDGIRAAKEIHKKLGKRAPYIIAMTANVFEHDKKACFNAGMNDFLAKPIRPTELRLCLQKHLTRDKVA